MPWQSTKQYGHDLGLSCAFRQWRAESHCNKIHGYAMCVKFIFESYELDVRNWVCDFGSLKSLKGKLEDLLDHKTLVAEDDPSLWWFQEAERRGILDLRVLPSVGCERLAEYIYEVTEIWLIDNGYSPRVRLVSVEVKEHGANSALYLKKEEVLKIRKPEQFDDWYFDDNGLVTSIHDFDSPLRRAENPYTHSIVMPQSSIPVVLANPENMTTTIVKKTAEQIEEDLKSGRSFYTNTNERIVPRYNDDEDISYNGC